MAKAAEITPGRRDRRKQDERSRETRERLLQATIDVLLEKGYHGLTMALVHDRAGLSSGARVHHYKTKADLVIAATALAYERAAEAGRKLAEELTGRIDPISGFLADSRTIYFDWPFIVVLEILLPARTDPALADRIGPIMEKYRRSVNDAWLAVLKAAGIPDDDAAMLLNLTLNLIRGMAINSVWQNNRDFYESMLAYWHRLICSVFEPLRKYRHTAD